MQVLIRKPLYRGSLENVYEHSYAYHTVCCAVLILGKKAFMLG
jgi:hypothetical protein